MELTALLGELKGPLSQEAWADQLGVSQRAVSGWLSGSGIGKEGLLALLAMYPGRRDEILAAVFAAEGITLERAESRVAGAD